MSEYSPEEINITTDSAAPRAKQYLHGFYTSNLAGAGDAARNFTSPGAYWVDEDRNEMRYEGAMPTNLGVDVRWRMRQFAANHANLNDFIVIELELTNTGVLDADGDGTAEKTDNRIHALTLHLQNEPINSMSNAVHGPARCFGVVYRADLGLRRHARRRRCALGCAGDILRSVAEYTWRATPSIWFVNRLGLPTVRACWAIP